MVRELLARTGTDRHLTSDELSGGAVSPFLREAWSIYQGKFGGYTAARVDAQFARLDQPALAMAQPTVAPGTTIVIAGTGPSLAARGSELRRLRRHISIWTTIRGAEALAAHDLAANLILVQHPSDLDAYLTVRHLRDRNGANPLASAPAVLVEPKTPSALLAGVRHDRLATFDPAIGWGLWPASLAWLACASGASAVVLAGIDLGRTDAPDRRQDPLRRLLALIALGSAMSTIDAGDGAFKDGWTRRALATAIVPAGSSSVTLDRFEWSSPDERRAALTTGLHELRAHLEGVQMFRARALECRGTTDGRDDSSLGEAWTTMLGWRNNPRLRIAFQEALGATFLPRFWRAEPLRLAGPMWRPVLLAADEITRQAQAAKAALESVAPCAKASEPRVCA